MKEAFLMSALQLLCVIVVDACYWTRPLSLLDWAVRAIRHWRPTCITHSTVTFIFYILTHSFHLLLSLLYQHSYPLIFVGARDGLLDLFKVSSENRTTGTLNKVTVGLMAIVTLLAAKLTDLGLVASVGGATFGTALVFVYPTIMFMRLMKQKGTKTGESKVAALIAIMGVIMGAIGTTMALKGVEV